MSKFPVLQTGSLILREFRESDARAFFRLDRTETLTYVDHEASAALLKKLGFREEGIRREYG